VEEPNQEEFPMRAAFAVVLLVGVGALAHAQPNEPEPRYGVKPRFKQYPQATPKEALRSALAAVEKGDYAYLAAHLLEPKFVEEAVVERARLFEAAAERELAQLRDFQRANPEKVAVENRVPLDPKAFRAMATERARDRAFKQLQGDIARKLADDPQAIKEMRRILRDGAFADTGDSAAATHPEVKGRALLFKKFSDRWFLENRQEEQKKEP
jgi:hypothetical protein